MGSKYKALLLGCGNIGALYDFKKDGVRTHAKAFSLSNKFETTVYDKNSQLAQTVADHYGFGCIHTVKPEIFRDFDAVVISTPTPTHAEYLLQLLEANVQVILCEKPVAGSLNELDMIRLAKTRSSSRVLVNYFRRFHPVYEQLKQYLQEIDQPLTNIQITYQRGFLNNATHALDLLHFLFGPADLGEIQPGALAFDEFEKDPTASLTAKFRNVPLALQGLQHVKHSFFEVKFWFESLMVTLEKNGEKISVYHAPQNPELPFYLPLEKMASPFDGINAIGNAMQHVIQKVQDYLDKPLLEDNFDSHLQLNYQTLTILESLCRN